ncbi:MAG: GNAT family N-acetyltransferase [Stellaceae bacterium]
MSDEATQRTSAMERPGRVGDQSWEILDTAELRDPGVVAAVRALMAQQGDRLLAHDPIWLAGPESEEGADSGTRPAAPCLLRRDGRLVGYAPFHRGTRALRFAVGELVLHRHRLPGLTLIHEPILEAASEDERVERICTLFRAVAARTQAIFLDGVPIDSSLSAATARLVASGWIVTPHGDSYEHYFADLPSSFAEYEDQLGSRSRKSLRYSRRKLTEHVGGAVQTRRFARSEQVPDFVAAAQAISRKTYQWNLLGLGLRDGAALAARLRLAADHGWMCCYLLYCSGQPVAFILGYLYRGVYHYTDVGYDPDWAKWSVGSVLQMDVMKDLLTEPERPDRFDFSTGFGTHKARFGNFSRREVNFLLLPDTLSNKWLARLYRLTLGIDKRAVAAADALGVKTRIKKWLRRVA